MTKRTITTDALKWLIQKIQGIKINGQTLGADAEITLTASDVGAATSTHSHSTYLPLTGGGHDWKHHNQGYKAFTYR